MIAILKKELRTYFNTLSGYIFLGFFVLINAYFFSQLNIKQGVPNYANTITYTFSMFLILIPVITMRLFAEEIRQKTDQLLYTSPVSIGKIVVGKFLAASVLFLIGVVIIALFPVILNNYGEVEFVQTGLCFLGYFLLASSLISIGIFISALTDNQIVAAVGTFASVFFILMMDSIIESMPLDTASSLAFIAFIIFGIAFILYNSTKKIFVAGIFFIIFIALEAGLYFYDNLFFDGAIVKVLTWFSVINHFESFYMGIFNLSDIVYYLTFICAFLYITINTIEKRRWK